MSDKKRSRRITFDVFIETRQEWQVRLSSLIASELKAQLAITGLSTHRPYCAISHGVVTYQKAID
jgi:CDGSH-type Zn-finger protein